MLEPGDGVKSERRGLGDPVDDDGRYGGRVVREGDFNLLGFDLDCFGGGGAIAIGDGEAYEEARVACVVMARVGYREVVGSSDYSADGRVDMVVMNKSDVPDVVRCVERSVISCAAVELNRGSGLEGRLVGGGVDRHRRRRSYGYGNVGRERALTSGRGRELRVVDPGARVLVADVW